MKEKKDNKKVKYIYEEEFKTDIDNPSLEELIDIFNNKFYKTIMKIEKSNFEGFNV